MRTNEPMTIDATQAATNGWTLVQWDAAYEAACDSAEAEHLAGTDPDDTDALEAGRKAVADAVTNAWDEGRSHDEWVSAALRSLRRA
jgi:hypothetical protein